MANHCAAAGEFASQLGLATEVRSGVEQSYARWDGRGVPAGLSGEALALSARISHIAETAEVFERIAGMDEAVDVIGARSGTHFDPALVAVLQSDPASLFDGIDEDTFAEMLDLEPAERPVLTDGQSWAVGPGS